MIFFKFGTSAGSLDKIALVIGAIVGFLLGGWTELLTALLVLHLLDIITGLMVGRKRREINSSRMNAGIKKKVGSWMALILANVIDGVLFDGQAIALTGMVFVLIANEGISITENLGNLGIKLPKFITEYLEQIRGQGDRVEFTLGDPPSPEIERVIIEDEEGHIQEIQNKKEE